MKHHSLIDMDWDHEQAPQVCGIALLGPSSPTCPSCKKAKPLMVPGNCSTCNQTHGLGIFAFGVETEPQEG